MATANALLNSSAEANRSSERFCSAIRSTPSIASEIVGSYMRAEGACCRTCLSNTSTGVRPVNGGSPVRTRNNNTPNE